MRNRKSFLIWSRNKESNKNIIRESLLRWVPTSGTYKSVEKKYPESYSKILFHEQNMSISSLRTHRVVNGLQPSEIPGKVTFKPVTSSWIEISSVVFYHYCNFLCILIRKHN